MTGQGQAAAKRITPVYYQYLKGFDMTPGEFDEAGAKGWRLVAVDNGISYWERLGKL